MTKPLQLNLFEKVTKYKDTRKNKEPKIWAPSYWNEGLYYWRYKDGRTIKPMRTMQMQKRSETIKKKETLVYTND